MKAAYIIPLTRLPSHLEGFDYSIPADVETIITAGSIVEVHLRNRKTKGIVFKIHDSAIQTLKPIGKVMPPECAISQSDLQFLEWFSSYYAVSLSVAALQMTPFLDGTYGNADNEQRSNTQRPTLVYSPSYHLRIDHYRQTIQELQGQNKQVLIICPTIASVYMLTRELSDTFPENQIAVVHSGLGKPLFRKNAQTLRDGTALIGIGTRMLSFAPCASLGAVILHDAERQEHKQYDSHPRSDSRVVAFARATIEGARAYITSAAPRLEEWVEKDKSLIYQELPADINTTVIDLSDEMRNENYSFISDHLAGLIEKNLREQKKSFLVLSAKGFSRLVMCAACSYIFTCDSCKGLPRYSKTTSSLICSTCSASRPLPETCPQCKGMHYIFPGLGREKIVSYLRQLFPHTSIGEATVSGKEANSMPSIAIGYASLYSDYPHAYSPLGLLGFIAADPVISMADIRATERQWQADAACMSVASSQKADIVIQAFNSRSRFIQTLAKMDFPSFASNELAIRQGCKQPPFSRIVRVFPSARAKVSDADRMEVRSRFEKIASSSPQPFITITESTSQKSKGELKELVMTIEMRYHPLQLLPDSLLKTLRSLPKGFLHDIDPL
ncbi:hypothetical protein HY622_03150 [Candidatus Uhrbacteria bacterium]|nr:hypothetical protein [Candidatus Uhrbacteria bacterium]